MRLISQKDLPRYTDAEYEDGIITVVMDCLIQDEANVIYSWNNSEPDEVPILMAKYSSRRKAEKVLEDMAKMYGSYISCNGGSGILQGSGYQQAFCFLPPKVFRFPADDEVEV